MQPPNDSGESFKPNQLQEDNFLADIQGESPKLELHKEPSILEEPQQKSNKKVDLFESNHRGSTRKSQKIIMIQGKINYPDRKRRSDFKMVKIAGSSKPLYIKQIAIFLEKTSVTVTMMMVTLYALFGDDIRQLQQDKNVDPVFYVLTILCMLMFTIEIILNSISIPDYLLGYYFWLDVLATITMFLDIGWIQISLFGADSTNQSAEQLIKSSIASKANRRAISVIRIIRLVRLVKLYKQVNSELDKAKFKRDQKNSLKMSQQLLSGGSKPRSSIFQTPPPKILYNPHDINLFDRPLSNHPDEESKFIDFVKIEDLGRSFRKLPPIQHSPAPENTVVGEHTKSNIKKQESSPAETSPPYGRKISETQQLLQPLSSNLIVIEKKEVQVESKVGQALQERTMKRVITIILSIVISIPIFDYATYKDAVTSYQTGLDRMFQFSSGPQELFNVMISEYVNFHAGSQNPISYVFINQTSNDSCCGYSSSSNFTQTGPDDSPLRDSDTNLYLSFDQSSAFKGYCITNSFESAKIDAILSMIRTFFVCCVLGFSAVIFSTDVQNLVLDPIDRMLKKVDRIAKNPLEAAQFEEQEELVLEELEKSNNLEKITKNQEEQKMETAILEKLIMKIGALLAVGFGEAGSGIIAQNMSQGGEVDPMLPGKKMLAIFGFCDIRNFTDATEVLQTGVMVFVNEIAEIVHGTADHYNGSANKNIGDAFLLVWKFKPEDYEPDKNDPTQLRLIVSKRIQYQADLSVIAFLKIITGVSISRKLEKYKSHPGLTARLTNYSVKLGFGLHMGWAIEGAIGSNYKIDASYLSPNVNMASRLEAATKQFGSSILISGILRQYLSIKCQSHLRHIDTVTVKGSEEPIEIHTVDISYKTLVQQIPKTYDIYDSSSLSKGACKRFRVVNRFKRDQLKEKVFSGLVDVADEFDSDPELKAIRQVYTPVKIIKKNQQEFYELWKQGFNLYLLGNWGAAKTMFEKTLEFIPDHRDGPSSTLLQVILEEGGKPPSSWTGCRELTEK